MRKNLILFFLIYLFNSHAKSDLNVFNTYQAKIFAAKVLLLGDFLNKIISLSVEQWNEFNAITDLDSPCFKLCLLLTNTQFNKLQKFIYDKTEPLSAFRFTNDDIILLRSLLGLNEREEWTYHLMLQAMQLYTSSISHESMRY